MMELLNRRCDSTRPTAHRMSRVSQSVRTSSVFLHPGGSSFFGKAPSPISARCLLACITVFCCFRCYRYSTYDSCLAWSIIALISCWTRVTPRRTRSIDWLRSRVKKHIYEGIGFWLASSVPASERGFKKWDESFLLVLIVIPIDLYVSSTVAKLGWRRNAFNEWYCKRQRDEIE